MKQSKIVWVRIVLGGLLMVASYYQHRTIDLLTKPTEQSNNSRGSELYGLKCAKSGTSPLTRKTNNVTFQMTDQVKGQGT